MINAELGQRPPRSRVWGTPGQTFALALLKIQKYLWEKSLPAGVRGEASPLRKTKLVRILLHAWSPK